MEQNDKDLVKSLISIIDETIGEVEEIRKSKFAASEISIGDDEGLAGKGKNGSLEAKKKDDDDEDEDDPRLELARPLLEYLQMKSAAEQLAERNLLGENTFVRNPAYEDYMKDQDEEVIQVGLFELIDAFKKILENISDDQRLDLTADNISVKDKIAKIVDLLENQASITFGELFSSDVNKGEIILTFLAILEMVKLSLVRIVQHVHTGIIRIFYL